MKVHSRWFCDSLTDPLRGALLSILSAECNRVVKPRISESPLNPARPLFPWMDHCPREKLSPSLESMLSDVSYLCGRELSSQTLVNYSVWRWSRRFSQEATGMIKGLTYSGHTSVHVPSVRGSNDDVEGTQMHASYESTHISMRAATHSRVNMFSAL